LLEKRVDMKFSKIRVLETGHNSGSWNMALDEVLMNGLERLPS